jgi:heme exporter protein D
MNFGPYAPYILTSYALAAVVVLILIAWIARDHRGQTRRLRELEQSGFSRRSILKAADPS